MANGYFAKLWSPDTGRRFCVASSEFQRQKRLFAKEIMKVSSRNFLSNRTTDKANTALWLEFCAVKGYIIIKILYRKDRWSPGNFEFCKSNVKQNLWVLLGLSLSQFLWLFSNTTFSSKFQPKSFFAWNKWWSHTSQCRFPLTHGRSGRVPSNTLGQYNVPSA